MIRFIAEHSSEPGEYEKFRQQAESWKECLRTIGTSANGIWQRLSAAGLDKTEQAVRIWLTDANLIGPGNIEDLELIARVAENHQFAKSITRVWEAIRATRGAHTAAGFRLSNLLVRHLPGQLPELKDAETIVELTLENIPLGHVAIVGVEEISDEVEPRPYWEVNRLLWDDN